MIIRAQYIAGNHINNLDGKLDWHMVKLENWSWVELLQDHLKCDWLLDFSGQWLGACMPTLFYPWSNWTTQKNGQILVLHQNVRFITLYAGKSVMVYSFWSLMWTGGCFIFSELNSCVEDSGICCTQNLLGSHVKGGFNTEHYWSHRQECTTLNVWTSVNFSHSSQ